MRGESPGVSSRPHTHTQDNSTKTGPTSTSTPTRHVKRARDSKIIELDPMRRMFDVLEAGGYGPHGPADKFRSGCPGHAGDSQRSLRVGEGWDGRVLLRCMVGCEPEQIIAALGLRWADLFPAGHRNGPKQKPRPVKSLSAGAAFLDAMTGAGYRWHAQLLGVECPYCSDPNAYLTVHDAGGLDVNCSNDCGAQEVRRAVETRAAIAEKGLDLGRKDAA